MNRQLFRLCLSFLLIESFIVKGERESVATIRSLSFESVKTHPWFQFVGDFRDTHNFSSTAFIHSEKDSVSTGGSRSELLSKQAFTHKF